MTHYWLLKSEPSCFSIDDLARRPKQTTFWDGVRNYQARNLLRDTIKIGDKAFFYHSNATPPGIIGIVDIVSNGTPDKSALNPEDEHYDPTATPDNPRWYGVDVRLEKKFSRLISLDELKLHPGLAEMQVTRRGNRLSVTPVTRNEWQRILAIIDRDAH